jgi:hypothetical protein
VTSAGPLVPATRTLPALLRKQFDQLGADSVRLVLARVVAVPDAHRVEISYGGASAVVPRLDGYTPVVGHGVYVLATRSFALAIGEAQR